MDNWILECKRCGRRFSREHPEGVASTEPHDDPWMPDENCDCADRYGELVADIAAIRAQYDAVLRKCGNFRRNITHLG